jgi:hypothetical protein
MKACSIAGFALRAPGDVVEAGSTVVSLHANSCAFQLTK